jgi:hypothetical protein
MPPGIFAPDTMGAVGKAHVVELTNAGYAVYRKSDGALVQDGNGLLADFWVNAGVTPVGVAFDPRVLYDASSERWFAVSIDGLPVPGVPLPATNRYLVAVSNSADPTAGWTGFAIESDATGASWADFPMLGMDSEGLYVGAVRVAVANGANLGPSLLVIPKADLLAASPSVTNATLFANLSPNWTGFLPHPVVNLDGTGLPAGFLNGGASSFGFVQSTELVGPIEAPALMPSEFISVPPLDQGAPFLAAQPGDKLDLDAGDRRFSANPVQVDGSIWTAQSTLVDGRVAVRWSEFDAATNILLQSGDVTDPVLDLYYPSIAVNELGQVVIGMSGSSETDFAGAYAIVGETLGGITTFGDVVLLQAGLADYENTYPILDPELNRWGDYSATVVDPSDPRRFWTFQEYALAEDVWAVRVTELILVPEAGTAGLVAIGGLLGLAARHNARRRRLE